MPTGRLSEKDRLRLAELMRAPLVSPQVHAEPPLQTPKWQRFGKVMHAATKKTRELWNTQPLVAIKRHLLAHRRRWAASTTVLAVCMVVLAVAVKVESRSGIGSIQLRALDRRGQLQIRWDPDSELVRRAQSAKLYIIDGAERLFVKLDGAWLRRGAVSYARRSNRVELRMALAEPDGQLIEQQATFVGTHPSNADESQLEAAAKPGAPAPAETPKPTGMEHRARRKPLVESGTELPFTCLAGDVFRKTDAPAGWDTFACRGRNVWSLERAQVREDRSVSKPNPNATTLSAKPANPSTT